MWLCPLLLWLLLSLALSSQREPEAPEDAGELHCGPQGLQFTVHPLGPGSGTPPALIAWGKAAASTHLAYPRGNGSSAPAASTSALRPPVLSGALGFLSWAVGGPVELAAPVWSPQDLCRSLPQTTMGCCTGCRTTLAAAPR